MKQLNLFFGLFVTLVATSCTNIATSISPSDASSRGLKSGEGYIVGTFTHHKPIGVERDPGMVTGYNLTAKGRGGSKKTSVLISNQSYTNGRMTDISMFQAKPITQGVFVIPVDAGDYEINGWRISAVGYGASLHIQNKGDMSVPFRVEAGRATFIGRANVLTRYGKNIVQMPVLGDGIILLSDDYAADRKKILSAYPALRNLKIDNAALAKKYASQIQNAANNYDNLPWYKKLVAVP